MNKKERDELIGIIQDLRCSVTRSLNMIPLIRTMLDCLELLIKQNDMSIYSQMSEEGDGGISTYDELLKRLKEKED